MATIEYMPARLTPQETGDLRQAIACLEGASFAQRLTDAVGRPVGMLGRTLPQPARRVIAQVRETALRGALRLALRTLDLNTPAKSANRAHKLALAASGAVGGRVGTRGAAGRTADIDHDPSALDRRDRARGSRGPECSRGALACVEVFALGGQAAGESAFESGYFAVRAALAKAVSDSARFVAAEGVAALPAPVIARLISQVAARFGIVVSEKIAAQAAPVLGAIGGAAVNAAFADHFQTLARGHFIVRRLERRHGASLIAFEYQRLRGERARERTDSRRAAS
jgi:EcsC protein family